MLALFVLLVNSSASLVLHYCHDQIAYVALVYQENLSGTALTEDSCCAHESISEKFDEESCCSNQKIKVEKEIDYSILKDIKFQFEAVNFQDYSKNPLNSSAPVVKSHDNLYYYCNSHAPPFYKLYSQLIFYA